MTRDYKNAPTRASRNGGSGKTVITGIVIGLLMGIVIALGIALFLNRSPSPFANKTQQPQPRKQVEARPALELKTPAANPAPSAGQGATAPLPESKAGEAKSADTTPGDKPRFDFYDILPGDKDPSRRPVEKSARDAPAVKVPEKAPEKSAEKTASLAGRNVYYIQAGSFRSAADADNLKARLALMGLQANVLAADVPNVGTMHRVRVGPYRSTEEVDPVKGQLAQNGIRASVVKLPAPGN